MLSQKKRCKFCKRIYTFNPSTGDFGTVCKYCGKSQLAPILNVDSKEKGSKFSK